MSTTRTARHWRTTTRSSSTPCRTPRWHPCLVAHGYDGPLILEIRYRHALSLGDPLSLMGQSYAVLHTLLNNPTETGENRRDAEDAEDAKREKK